MRVGASRPRQTSQGDDKERNMNYEETTTIDNRTTSGKDGYFGNNNQKSQEIDDEQQDSGYKRKIDMIYKHNSIWFS